MGRKAKLDQPDIQEEFIGLIQSGMTFETAAESLGISPRTAYRRKVSDQAFADAVAEAMLGHRIPMQAPSVAPMLPAVEPAVEPVPPEQPTDTPPEPDPARDEPTEDPSPTPEPGLPEPGDLVDDLVDDLADDFDDASGDVAAADMANERSPDEEWLDAWATPGRSKTKRRPPMGLASTDRFIQVMWARFLRDGKDADKYARLLGPVLLGPQIREQMRLAKLAEMADEMRGQLGDGQSGGMIVLEVPANPARPHLHESAVVDAEFTDVT